MELKRNKLMGERDLTRLRDACPLLADTIMRIQSPHWRALERYMKDGQIGMAEKTIEDAAKQGEHISISEEQYQIAIDFWLGKGNPYNATEVLKHAIKSGVATQEMVADTVKRISDDELIAASVLSSIVHSLTEHLCNSPALRMKSTDLGSASKPERITWRSAADTDM